MKQEVTTCLLESLRLTDGAVAGGKGANLGELSLPRRHGGGRGRAGSTGETVVGGRHRAAIGERAIAKQARTEIAATGGPDALEREIMIAHRALLGGRDHIAVAVRPWATAEAARAR